MGQSGSATAPTASGAAAVDVAAVASAAPLASLVYATSGPFSQFALPLSVSLFNCLSLWSKLSGGATVNVKLANCTSANLLQFPGPNKCNVAHFQCNANSRFSPQLGGGEGGESGQEEKRLTVDSPGNFLMQDYPR